jgi:hypothetical protein
MISKQILKLQNLLANLLKLTKIFIWAFMLKFALDSLNKYLLLILTFYFYLKRLLALKFNIYS